MPGKPSGFGPLDAHALYVFQTATADLTGVTYEPISVRTQLVNGTNYTYIAKATPMTATQVPYYVTISVYEAPASSGGQITLGDITPITNVL